jgi:DNA-binding CsgD family transcriptional regulator
MSGRVIDFEAAEAEGRCECGASLDDHPPIPAPLPWDYGRPCAKTSLQRGHGWDGRPAIEHSEAQKARWHGQGSLTDRQSELLRTVAKHDGNQSAAARELGVTQATVSVGLKRLREKGVTEATA